MRRMTLALLVAFSTASGLAAADQPRHLEDAIRAQERLAGARPGDVRVLNDLGNLLALADRTERAEEVYRRALEIAPDEPTLHYNLGLLMSQTGRARAAMEALQRVVEIDPQDAWGHYQLATLLEQRGKRSKAIHHFAQAFLIDPTLAELEVNPQLLDSRLVSPALTLAYTERAATLEAAPRQYQQPKRITRLLVPEARRKPTQTGDEADAGEEPPAERKQRKKKKSTGAP